MPRARIDVYTKDFQPAAVGSAETTAIFNVRAGDRVVWASVEPLILSAGSTTNTMELGDGDDTDGFIVGVTSGAAGAFDLETATVGVALALVPVGAYLATSGGKLYIVDDTIDVKYVIGTPGATNPKARFRIGVVKERQ